MADMDQIDVFTDVATTLNPQPYLEHLRSKGPVTRLPGRNIVAVTGYDEGMAVFRDSANFSSVFSFAGPLVPADFGDGDDLTDEIARIRPSLPGGDTVITADVPEHARIKSLLTGVITPKRAKANESFIERVADEQIRRFIDRGKAEMLTEYGRPIASAAVGELLGVPLSDLPEVSYTSEAIAGGVDSDPTDIAEITDERLRGYFRRYVEERRANPRADVMSEVAGTRYADGSLPSVEDVVSLAALLFAAGEDTASRVIIGAIRWVAEDQALQARLRADPSLIPGLVEEVLRYDGPGLAVWRLAKREVRVGDMTIAPGTMVMLALPAMNRDPGRFADAARLEPQRPNNRDHVAFGRGVHACPGAPVARAEVRIAIERLLHHTARLEIDGAAHGPEGAREYRRLPSYFVQGLNDLHVTFEKA